MCKAWAAAAVSATTSIQYELYQDTAQQKLPGLESWLSLPGQQLTSLCITHSALWATGDAQPATAVRHTQVGSLQLPTSKLARLQELTLECVTIKLAPRSPASTETVVEQRSLADAALLLLATAASTVAVPSTASAACGVHCLLTALRRLDLKHCAMDTFEDLVQLAQSTVLTSLQLDTVSSCRPDDPSGPWPTALQKVIAMPHGAALHSLQDLSITLPSMIDAADEWPAALPYGLTRLVVSLADVRQSAAADQPGVLPTAATSSCFFSSLKYMQELQELQLRLCQLDPDLLGCISSLRKLQLDRCQLLPGKQAGTRALLEALRGLTQLQDIQFCAQSGCTSGVAPELFAALTASAQLTSLEVAPIGGQPLTAGAMRHIFPAGCWKPQLRVLRLRGAEGGWSVDNRDLHGIAAACPGLRELDLSCVVKSGSLCAGLQLFPNGRRGLTRLSLAGDAFGDATVAAVSHLKKLKFLQWYHSSQLSDVGFQYLTSLAALTWLRFDGSRPSALSDDLFRGRDNPRDRILRLSDHQVNF